MLIDGMDIFLECLPMAAPKRKSTPHKRAARPSPKKRKERITLRLDPNVVAWARSRSENYQTFLNRKLCEEMEREQRHEAFVAACKALADLPQAERDAVADAIDAVSD
ncbi:MAG: BrnA antitoxin family protein [Hyphomicrobium sp.]